MTLPCHSLSTCHPSSLLPPFLNLIQNRQGRTSALRKLHAISLNLLPSSNKLNNEYKVMLSSSKPEQKQQLPHQIQSSIDPLLLLFCTFLGFLFFEPFNNESNITPQSPFPYYFHRKHINSTSKRANPSNVSKANNFFGPTTTLTLFILFVFFFGVHFLELPFRHPNAQSISIAYSHFPALLQSQNLPNNQDERITVLQIQVKSTTIASDLARHLTLFIFFRSFLGVSFVLSF